MTTVLLFLAFVLMVGLVRSQGALIMLSSLLIVTAVGSTWWSRRAPFELSYRRSFDPPRIFPGEPTDYVVEINNRKLLPLPWVRIDEHMPAAVLPRSGGPEVAGEDGWQRRRSVSLGWHERLVLRQRFTCHQRGHYVVGPTDVETGDPLALFPVQMRFPGTHSLVVYPRVADLHRTAIASQSPFGATSARPPVLDDPLRFAGIRDYRPGDPRRWVDWKASARRMKLQTRVFAPTTMTNVIVALNIQTMPFAWQGHDREKLEAAIGVAAALVRQASAERQPVGLAVNASGAGMEDFQVFLPPSRRPTQLEDTLAVLAGLAPIPTIAFAPFLRRIAAHFPYGASLRVVTAFVDDATAHQLGELAERGHQVALTFLGADLPEELGRRVSVTVLPEVAFEPISPNREPVAS